MTNSIAKFDLPYNQKVSPDKKTLIKNVRIIDPQSGFDQIGSLLIIGDKIADFGANLVNNLIVADQIIDGKGLVLAPGLIDMQVHFRDPGQTHKEDLAREVPRQLQVGLPRWFVNLTPLQLLIQF